MPGAGGGELNILRVSLFCNKWISLKWLSAGQPWEKL